MGLFLIITSAILMGLGKIPIWYGICNIIIGSIIFTGVTVAAVNN